MCDCTGNNSIGGNIGGYIGSRAGHALGEAVKFGAKKLFLGGMGAYSLKANSLVNGGGVEATGNVDISPAGPDNIRVTKREYLTDVFTSPTGLADNPSPFNLQSFEINPGLIQTFPWLSTIAQQYEQYELRGLVFEFRPTVSEYNTQGGLGTVMMGTEYDNLDTIWSSKVEFMNAAYSNEGKPTEHIIHGVECAPAESRGLMFVRGQALPSNGDINDFDKGRFYIATQGYGNGTPYRRQNLGSLFVHYDVILLKAQLGGGILQKNVPFVRYNLVSGPTAITAANLFSSAINTFVTGNAAVVTLGGNTLTFPTWGTSGTWSIQHFTNGSAQAYSGLSFTIVGGIIGPNFAIPTTSYADAPASGVVSADTSLSFVIRQTEQVCVLTCTAFGMTGVTGGFLMVTLVPEGFYR